MQPKTATKTNDPVAERLPLPASLAECTMDNKMFVLATENFFAQPGKTLTQDTIFEVVAQKYFPEWGNARDALAEAQKNLDNHDMPLGNIGQALDGGVMAGLEDKVMQALVEFTMINERLHQDKGIKEAVQMLHHVQSTCRNSQLENLRAMSATKQFGNVASAASSLRQNNGEIQSNWMKGTLSERFKNHHRKRLTGDKLPFSQVVNGGLRQLLQKMIEPQKDMKFEKTAAMPGIKPKTP